MIDRTVASLSRLLWLGLSLLLLIIAAIANYQPQPAAAKPQVPSNSIRPATDRSSANMVVNGGLETGALLPWITPIAGGSAVLNSTPAFVHTGNYSIKVTTAVGDESGIGGGGDCPGGVRIPVTAGTRYMWGGWIFVPATSSTFWSAFIRIRWYSGCSGGSPLQPLFDGSQSIDTATGQWKHVVGIANAPTGAHYAELQLVARPNISNQTVNVYFDDITMDLAPPPAACGPGSDYLITQSTGAAIVPGTTDIGSHCDSCLTRIDLPFLATFYGINFDSVDASDDGTLHFVGGLVGDNICLPTVFPTDFDFAIAAYWDDMITFNGGHGIYTSTTGAAPNRIFNIEWRACKRNGASCGDEVQFEARLYEGQDRFDLIYGLVSQSGNTATVGVQRSDGSNASFSQFSCNSASLQAGLKLTFQPWSCSVPSPTITLTPTISRTPTVTRTPTLTPIPTCGPGSAYIYQASAGATIVPGTADIGNHCATTCQSFIGLPFPVQYYGQTYTTVAVGSEGFLNFAAPAGFLSGSCFPVSGGGPLMLPFWRNLDTSTTNCPTCGVFSSTSGSAPNRIYNLEWRATLPGTSTFVNFEVRLYESQDRFDFIYGTVSPSASSPYTVGVQRPNALGYTQVSCPPDQTFTNGLQITFRPYTCGEQTFTPTPSRTATITQTRTRTATITLTRTYTPTPTRTLTLTATNSPTQTLTRTPTLVPSPTPELLLVGHVTWQGRPTQPNLLNQMPITLTLQLEDTITTYPNQQTDASGFFTVTVTTLRGGVYTWWAKGPQFLANTGAVALTGAPVLQQEMGLQRAGDINDDNGVDIADFGLLRASFGQACGDPAYNPGADFTGDCMVDITDFGLLRGNFGQTGAPPPTGPTPQAVRDDRTC